MSRSGGRFSGGVELPIGANVIRLIVREIDSKTFNWLADVRIRTPFVPLADGLGEPNTESSAESAQQAVRAAVSFFASCGVHLSPEQRLALDRAVVLKSASKSIS